MAISRKRLICILIPTFLLFVLVIFLAMRWKTWFHNYPEEPYATPDSVDRLTLTPGVDICQDATISWRAGSILRSGWIMLSSDSSEAKYLPAQAEEVESRGGKDAYYTVRLRRLQPGVRYHLSAHTTGCANSDTLSFALPQPDSTLKIIYLGDFQDIALSDAKSKIERIHPFLSEVDLCLQVGDLIERPMNKYWDLVYASLGSTLMKKNFAATPGNHEIIKGFFKRVDPRWAAQFHYPLNGPKGQEGLSYYIDHPFCRIVSLNSNHVDFPLDLYRQRSWLEETLASARQPFLIVMMHHSVKPVRSSRSHPIMYRLLRPILEKYRVDLVLAGHDHAYARTTHPKDNEYRAAPPVYLISSFSDKCYENGFSPIFDRLGSGTSFYSLLHITRTQLEFVTYTIDQQETDRFRITRPVDAPDRSVFRFEDLGKDLPEYLLFDSFADSPKGQAKRDVYHKALLLRKQQQKGTL